MTKIIKNALEEPKIQTCPACGSVWELEPGENELNECPVCGVGIEVKDIIKDPKTRTIDAVMEELDFEKIHKAMVALDWKWWNEGVPSVQTLKKNARKHLEYAWDHKCSTGSGGLWAEYEGETEEDYPLLRLSFEVSWAGPCWVHKKDNEMQYA